MPGQICRKLGHEGFVPATVGGAFRRAHGGVLADVLCNKVKRFGRTLDPFTDGVQQIEVVNVSGSVQPQAVQVVLLGPVLGHVHCKLSSGRNTPFVVPTVIVKLVTAKINFTLIHFPHPVIKIHADQRHFALRVIEYDV